VAARDPGCGVERVSAVPPQPARPGMGRGCVAVSGEPSPHFGRLKLVDSPRQGEVRPSVWTDVAVAMKSAPYDGNSCEDAVHTPRASSQDFYVAAWSRLRSASPRDPEKPSAPAEVREPAGRAEFAWPARHVAWHRPARGLPLLPRAWRTPDPSPTREGDEDLPAARCSVLVPVDLGVPPPPPFGDAAKHDLEVLSAGSYAHPIGCGEPCKYFWKASGCKDGAGCKRCHFCKWVRPRKKGLHSPFSTDGQSTPASSTASSKSKAKSAAEPRLLLLSEMVV